MLIDDNVVYGSQEYQDIIGKAIRLHKGVYESEALNAPWEMKEKYMKGWEGKIKCSSDSSIKATLRR